MYANATLLPQLAMIGLLFIIFKASFSRQMLPVKTLVQAGGLEPPMFTAWVTVLQTAAVATEPRLHGA